MRKVEDAVNLFDHDAPADFQIAISTTCVSPVAASACPD